MPDAALGRCLGHTTRQAQGDQVESNLVGLVGELVRRAADDHTGRRREPTAALGVVGRVKQYTLTEQGRAQLRAERSRWENFSASVSRVLEARRPRL